LTASWCHSSGLGWVVLLDGHTWQIVKCPAAWSQIPCVMVRRDSPLKPIADSATPNCFYLGCRTLQYVLLYMHVGHTLMGQCLWMNFS